MGPLVIAQESFWPTSAGGWVPLLAFAGALLGGGWAGVRKITKAIDNIAVIPVHTELIDGLGDKADALDRGQVEIIEKLDTIQGGMATAAEMTTHTNQDAAQFDKLDKRLMSIDGRLGRVEEHVGIERLDPEQRLRQPTER